MTPLRQRMLEDMGIVYPETGELLGLGRRHKAFCSFFGSPHHYLAGCASSARFLSYTDAVGMRKYQNLRITVRSGLKISPHYPCKSSIKTP